MESEHDPTQVLLEPPDVENVLDSPPKNPWVSVWLSPRATVRQLFHKEPVPGLFALYCFYGLNRFLDRASDKSFGDHASTATILGLAVLLSPLIGWVNLAFWGWLLRVTGEYIGGKGDAKRIHTAVVWASLPRAAGVLIWIVLLSFFGGQVFREEMPQLDANPDLAYVFFIAVGVGVILSLWSLVLLTETLAEAQGFSRSRAIGNLLLSAGAILIPILVIVGILYSGRG